MKQTILFIHGMFQNSRSWGKWEDFFQAKGYTTISFDWPLHEGDPAALRENPPKDLGDLRLETVIRKAEEIIAGLSERPIVIGHSVGGLIAQLLTSKNLVRAAVPVNSVAPNRMLSLDWDFFKNSVSIANPFKGDEPFYMDEKGFHASFANTLDEASAKIEFVKSATHDSRNILRDCMKEDGTIDLKAAHTPLLFIAGDKDKIIPEQLVEKNAKGYTDERSISDYKEFPGRSHYICNEPGWEEVANYVYDWLQKNAVAQTTASAGALA